MKTIVTYCLIITGVILTSSCQFSGNNKKVKKDIALQLYSLRDSIGKDFSGFSKTIQAVGEMGYTSIEAANYDDGKFYGLTPEDFKQAIENAGMKVLASHTAKQLNSTHPDSIDWETTWAWWDQCIDAHKTAGMQYIVTPWMAAPATLQELQVYCDYYNRIGERCKAKGLQFGYHNHAHEFAKIEGQMMYDYMLEHTDPELVFFQMDVYWTVRGGQSPVEYFQKYPGRFELLHIKDHKELGQSGMVGFDAIFNHTNDAGVKHIIVEVEKYNYPAIESVKRSLDYLLECPLVKTSYEAAH